VACPQLDTHLQTTEKQQSEAYKLREKKPKTCISDTVQHPAIDIRKDILISSQMTSVG
jgi:hypothetical protein